MMGGTNNLFDRKNNRSSELEVVEEIEHIICKYINCGIKKAIVRLTGRRYRYVTIKRLNKCNRRLAEPYGI